MILSSYYFGPALTVLLQAKHAIALAQVAEAASEYGSQVWAGLLYAAAERCHLFILGAICNLTDAEADSIEPEVTDLEHRLYRLAVRTLRPDPKGNDALKRI